MQRRFKEKLLAGVLALLTAFSPAVSVIPVYAADDNDGDNTVTTLVDAENDTVDEGISVGTVVEDSHHISIDLNTFYGEVVVNEGKPDEQTVRITKDANGKTKSTVTDAEGHVTEAEVTTEHPFALIVDADVNEVINVAAKADHGYEVSQYSITIDSGAKEATNFETDKYATFQCDIVADADKVVTVNFVPVSEGIELESNSSIEVSDVEEGIEIGEETPDSVVIEGEEETGAQIDVESETDVETTTDADGNVAVDAEVDEAGADSKIEVDVETETEDETQLDEDVEVAVDAETEETDDIEVESESDAFASVFLGEAEGTELLNAADFASMRLVVLVEDASQIIDPQDVIGNYDSIYLLQYTSVQQAMNAYVYYVNLGLAVEPDAVIETASDDAVDEMGVVDDTPIVVTENENPVEALNDAEDANIAPHYDNVIALIDTGASEGANVVDRISLIDDVISGSWHADDMVNAIVSQNADAKILSIRAMNSDGRGTVSSLISAIEYAINQNVSIINLSLYGRTTLATSVLAAEIQKATAQGIIVVGAAGNDGADVAGYMPGSVADAYIIGAANADGSRLDSSNYGSTVDYYTVANSTSEAAAKFSGWLSAGNSAENVDGHIFFALGEMLADDDGIEVEDGIEIETEPVENADLLSKFAGISGDKVLEDGELQDVSWSIDENGVLTVGDATYSNYLPTYLNEDLTVLSDASLSWYAYETQEYVFAYYYNREANDGILRQFIYDSGFVDPNAEFVDDYPEDLGVAAAPSGFPNSINAEFKITGHYSGSAFTTTEGLGPDTTHFNGGVKVTSSLPAGISAGSWDMRCDTKSAAYTDQGATGAWQRVTLNYTSKSTSNGKTVCLYSRGGIQYQGLYLTNEYNSAGRIGYQRVRVLIKLSGSTTKNLDITKTPDTSNNACVRTIYRNGKISDGLLRPYANLTTTFEIWSTKSNGSALNKKLGTVTTDASGHAFLSTEKGKSVSISDSAAKAILEKMNIGDTYALKETVAPPNYINNHNGTNKSQANAPVFFKFSKATGTKVTVTDPAKGDPGQVFLVKKAQNSGAIDLSYPMVGAKFRLEYYETDADGWSNPSPSPTYTYTLTSKQMSGGMYGIGIYDIAFYDNAGSVVWATSEHGYLNVPIGTYIVKEIEAPVGFDIADGEFVGTVSYANGTQPDGGPVFKWRNNTLPIIYQQANTQLTMTEKQHHYGLEIKKEDLATGETVQGDSSLEGITFKVVNKSGHDVSIDPTPDDLKNKDEITYKDGAEIQLVRMTIKNGVASTPVILPAGTYEISELATNASYQKTDNTVCKVVIPLETKDGTVYSYTAGGNKVKNDGDDHVWQNIVVHGGVSIVKEDYLASNSDPHANTDLSGAEFTIVNASQNPVWVRDALKSGGSSWDKLTQTSMGGFHKVATSGLTGNPTYAQVKAAIGNASVGVITTDKYGNALTSADDLCYGTYYIIETKAPVGYDLNETWVGKVEVRNQGQIKKAVRVSGTAATGDQNADPDTIWTGGIKVQKSDYMRKGPKDHGNAKLAGAEFTILNASKTTAINYQDKKISSVGLSGTGVTYGQLEKFANNSKYVMEVITTNAKGEAQTSKHTCEKFNGKEGLPYGEYFVIETKAPAGYHINKEWVGRVVVSKDGEVYTPAALSGDYLHDGSAAEPIILGGADIVKQDYMFGDSKEYGDTDLSGAQFTIVNASAEVSVNYADKEISTTPLSDQSTYDDILNYAKNPAYVMEVLTTDKNGYARTSKHTCDDSILKNREGLPYGTYYVIETKAATGYHLNKEYIGKIVVTEEGKVYRPTDVAQLIYLGGLKLQKLEYMYVDYDAHGDTDLSGAEFTIVNASKHAVMNSKDKKIETTGLSGKNVTYEQVANFVKNSNYVMEVIKTNTKGEAQTSKHTCEDVRLKGREGLPYGTYYVIETKPATGYHLNTEWVGMVVVREEGVVYTPEVIQGKDFIPPKAQGDMTDDVSQLIYLGGLTITKQDYMLNRTADHGDTNLSGAEFTIVNGSKARAMNYQDKSIKTTGLTGDNVTYDQVAEFAKNPEYVMEVITTDRNGTAVTSKHTCSDTRLKGREGLPYGTYYVIETKPAVGYHLNTTFVGKLVVREEGKVLKPKNIGSPRCEDGSEDVPQTIWTSGLKVQKLDYMRDSENPHGDTDLSGAEFTIVNASDTIAYNYADKEIATTGLSGENVTYEDVAKFAKNPKYVMEVLVTNKLGEAQTSKHTCEKFKGIESLPYGTYYVIETKPPVGYNLNKEWVGMVEVRENGKIYTPTVLANVEYHRDINHTKEGVRADESWGVLGIPRGDDYGLRNQIYRAGISLSKIDLEMKDATRQGEATLEGAEFAIINASQAVIRNSVDEDVPTAKKLIGSDTSWEHLDDIAIDKNDDGTYSYTKYVAQVISTNKEGFATTGNLALPYGTYYVIETKSSDGYFLDKNFVGKVVVREDDIMMHLSDDTGKGSSFIDINDAHTSMAGTVEQQVRRGDITMMKVNIDGEYKANIPFLISAIRIEPDGSETVLESHVMVTDEFGLLNTSRPHSINTNGMDKYLVGNSAISEEGEKYLASGEAATWGVWFQGNADEYVKDALRDDYGALYQCHYRLTELKCKDNRDHEENLINSELIYITNDTVDYYTPMKDNADMFIYHPLVDTEIIMESTALDVESNTKTLPIRKEATIAESISYQHLSSEHKYRVATQVRDITDGNKVLSILGSPDEAATSISDDGAWLYTEFQPTKTSTTDRRDNTHYDHTVTVSVDTTGREGHVLMVVDYLYEHIDVANNDLVPGDWVLVKIHPNEGEIDPNQCVYLPDLHTNARDDATGDRVGVKSKTDKILDKVSYMNLSWIEDYVLTMSLVDTATGEVIPTVDGKTEVVSKSFFSRQETPVSGEMDMPDYIIDSSNFENKSVTVVERLYRADDKTGLPFGEPIVEHNSVMDEDQTIRYIDIHTTAHDYQTSDDVGSDGPVAVVYDDVKLENVIFDTDGSYTYDVKGKLVYQHDFNGHKAGEEVNVLPEGDVVDGAGRTVHYDTLATAKVAYVDGQFVVTYPNGESVAIDEKDVTINYGKNVAKMLSEEAAARGDNSYAIDDSLMICDLTITLQFVVNADELKGATTVVFEDLYHDSTGANTVLVAEHADIEDQGQMIHYAELGTSAADIDTGDHAGHITKMATVRDEVEYKNLVIGKEYTMRGVLYNQDTGKPITDAEGNEISAEATFIAGDISDVNKITSTNEAINSVDGVYTLVFTLDSRRLVGKSVVAFEDLYHVGYHVAAHAELYDDAQTIHYPNIHTTASDVMSGDHVGSIFGAFINGVRRILGETDADGNGIADDVQANIIDTVTLNNLALGHTYVVSGKIYDVTNSLLKESNVPLVIDGQEIIQAVTITVSNDGKITASDGSKTTVTNYDAEKHCVDGTVDLVYSFDSSKIQGKKIVVFEDLYQDVTYTPETNPDTVVPEDIIYTHSDINDEGQSVSEVEIHTTAVETSTGNHIGAVPSPEYDSVIKDSINLVGLVPGMEYTVKGVLVDLQASDLDNEKAMFLKADGTVTANRDEAYEETLTFVADETSGSEVLTFVLDYASMSDRVQGKALTVFEELWHNDAKISVHPALDEDGWDEESFQNQTVYYPTGKTNATDNVTGTHTSFAQESRIITDRVYFENLLVGDKYRIDGQLMYQEDFTDIDGIFHGAGTPFAGATKSVEFVVKEDMTEVPYVGDLAYLNPSKAGEDDASDGDDIHVDWDEIGGMAKVDSLKITTLPNGQKVASGYVSLQFRVDVSKLAGATLVAFEDFSSEGVKLFTHNNLHDLPQTIRIPEIHTNASVLDLDEASVYDDEGNFKDIEIVDTVSYSNLWTQPELDEMHTQGLAIRFADGTYRTEESPIYDINEKATYIMKGVLMDKETGKPLMDEAGKKYEVYSEPFSPASHNGTIDVTFVLNSGAFVKEGEKDTSLEGKTVVAFEDLYQTDTPDNANDQTHVAEHHNIEDVEQDIRFPKGRTHAVDGPEAGPDHDEDGYLSVHEIHESTTMQVTDLVSFENLHGATKYTLTGQLQLVTEVDENGVPTKWEAAKDDDGNELIVTKEFDTSEFSKDYNASVSGQVPITFTFSGKMLAGRTLVAFEKIEREGITVMVHADITDEGQTVYIPKIGTTAYDLLTGVNESLASKSTVIIDMVAYENLGKGTTYTLRGVLKDSATGETLSDVIEGKFIAGVDDQYITSEGTYVLTPEEYKDMLKGMFAGTPITGHKAHEIAKTRERVDGIVCVVIPVDSSELAGKTMVAFEKLYGDAKPEEGKTEDSLKPLATHEDLKDEAQSVNIPKISTNASVVDLDEACVVDENGQYRDIEITDTVSYENLTVGRSYILKGVMMDKETDAPLKNAAGNIYEVSTEPFTPEEANGKYDMKFVINAGDFVKDGESALEGKITVVFEDLYVASETGEIEEDKKVAEHHDIKDGEQDVRFPKARTHAFDGIDYQEGKGLASEGIIADIHDAEKTTTSHEVNATDDITIVDMVSVEGLHGATKYTVTGTLQVITKYAEDGTPAEYEAAVDDAGKAITSTVELDTTKLSDDYDASVSGYVPVVFHFSGVKLAGKTTVAFETVSRDGHTVAVHTDIKDTPQTVFLPNIHTNASDALTGLDSVMAGGTAVILDKVSYENLEKGKTYKLTGTLHKKSDSSEVQGATVTGTFVAGTDNQFIMQNGTRITTIEELRKALGGAKTQTTWSSGTNGNTNPVTNGITPTTGTGSNGNLDIRNKAELIVGKDIPAGYYKLTPVSVDNFGLFGYWCIYYSKDGTVPTARTLETTLANGILGNNNAEDYIRLADNMVLQLSTSVSNGRVKVAYQSVSASEAEPKLESAVADYFAKAGAGTVSSTNASAPSTTTSTTNTSTMNTNVNVGTPVDTTNGVKGDMSQRVSGEVYVVIPVDTKALGGETLVAFESLTAVDENGKDKVIAVHEDINDEDQSVRVPEIHTSAKINGGKTAEASTNSKVVDTVTYKGLTPGKEYQMNGVLMDKSTGKSTEVTASQTFTPKSADGTVDVTFTIDTTKLAGRQLVVFEELVTKGEDGKAYIVAEHKDLTDDAQTVAITAPAENRNTPNIDTGDMMQTGYLVGALSMVLLLAGLAILRRRKFHS